MTNQPTESPTEIAERLLPLSDLGVRCPTGWKCNSDYYRTEQERQADIEQHYQCEVIGDGRAVRAAVADFIQSRDEQHATALQAERERADALELALTTAINTVECASVDPRTGELLPWYVQARRALVQKGGG